MKYLCLVMAALAGVAVAACTSSGSRGAPLNSTATGPGAMRISDGRIAVASFGETRPAAEGHDEWTWRRNRRVEFASEALSER